MNPLFNSCEQLNVNTARASMSTWCLDRLFLVPIAYVNRNSCYTFPSPCCSARADYLGQYSKRLLKRIALAKGDLAPRTEGCRVSNFFPPGATGSLIIP